MKTMVTARQRTNTTVLQKYHSLNCKNGEEEKKLFKIVFAVCWKF